MKKIFSALFIIQIFVSAQLSGPKLYIPKDSHDFGTANEGEIIKFNYVLVNTGDDVLKISNVMTSCGCTVAEPKKSSLNPGESTVLQVEFNTKGRGGAQQKYVSFSTNDPKNPRAKVSILGNVLLNQIETVKDGPVLWLAENQFDFGYVKEGEKLTHTFKYKNTGTKVLEIENVTTSCGCTAAIVEGKSLKPGESGNLKVEFDTSNRFGRVSRNITIISNDPNGERKIITIYADIQKKES